MSRSGRCLTWAVVGALLVAAGAYVLTRTTWLIQEEAADVVRLEVHPDLHETVLLASSEWRGWDGVRDVDVPPLARAGARLSILPDARRLEEVGLGMDDVERAVREVLAGHAVTVVRDGGDLVVTGTDGPDGSGNELPDDLPTDEVFRLPVGTDAAGIAIPLQSVARVELGMSGPPERTEPVEVVVRLVDASHYFEVRDALVEELERLVGQSGRKDASYELVR